MKTPAFMRPALALLAAGLALGWTGCSSDDADKPEAMAPTRPVVSPAPMAPPPPVVVVSPPPPPATNPPLAVPQPATPPVASGNPPPAPGTAATNADGAPTSKISPQPPALAPGVQSIVDLVHAQVGTAVLLEYVKNSTNTFEIQPDDLIYLKDIGVPDEVVTAMLQRTPGGQAPAVPAEATAPVEAPAVASAPAPAPAVEPATVVTGTSTYINPVSAPPPPPATPPPPALSENYFYSTLSPYGSWLYIEPHGWCWQPTVAVVDTGWRPYCHGGRWRYTTAGWYWQSSYSWGWAPFHYGNWYSSPACGWVWVPGSTWGPAWVTWRYSDAYCGWAPLPPGCAWNSGFGLTYYGTGVSFGFGFNLGWSAYTFCGWNDCWGPYPYRHCVPGHRSVAVYNNTTIVNNYYGDTKTVVNHGVPPASMPVHVRKELRPAQLNDVTHGGGQVRPERANVDGSRLAVYRPRVPADLKSSPSSAADQPYRPVRSRSESLATGRTGVAPERGLSTTPARTEPGLSSPSRTPQRSGSPTPGSTPRRMETPARSDVPGITPSRPDSRSATPASPSRSEPRTTVPATPSRSGTPAGTVPGRAPTPSSATPSRSGGSAPAAQPTVPSRSEPRATVPGTSSRSGSSVTPPAPARTPSPAPTPAAPSRMERSQPSTQPATPRVSPPASSTPSRGTSGGAIQPAPNTSRYLPPSRSVSPDYSNGGRSGLATTPAPGPRTAVPSTPNYAPGRSFAPAPTYSAPAPRSGVGAPPSSAGPAMRSAGPSGATAPGGSGPSFSGTPPSRSVPAGGGSRGSAPQ
jgi:hypothetical protein